MFSIGALEDSQRIHDLIMNNISKIDDIVITMDSHYRTHIAHQMYWKKGPNHPDIIAAKKKYKKLNKLKMAVNSVTAFTKHKNISNINNTNTNSNNHTMNINAETKSEASFLTLQNSITTIASLDNDNNDDFYSTQDIQHPGFFTVITYEDILNKIYLPVDKENLEWCKHYTKELEKQGDYNHIPLYQIMLYYIFFYNFSKFFILFYLI